MKTISIPEDEYRWLHALYLAALPVRRQGVQQFNRFPPAMRLAMTSLAAHYEERGLDERGNVASDLPAPLEQPDPISAPCPVCNAQAGELCSSIVNAAKTRRESHAARRSA